MLEPICGIVSVIKLMISTTVMMNGHLPLNWHSEHQINFLNVATLKSLSARYFLVNKEENLGYFLTILSALRSYPSIYFKFESLTNTHQSYKWLSHIYSNEYKYEKKIVIQSQFKTDRYTSFYLLFLLYRWNSIPKFIWFQTHSPYFGF